MKDSDPATLPSRPTSRGDPGVSSVPARGRPALLVEVPACRGQHDDDQRGDRSPSVQPATLNGAGQAGSDGKTTPQIIDTVMSQIGQDDRVDDRLQRRATEADADLANALNIRLDSQAL